MTSTQNFTKLFTSYIDNTKFTSYTVFTNWLLTHLACGFIEYPHIWQVLLACFLMSLKPPLGYLLHKTHMALSACILLLFSHPEQISSDSHSTRYLCPYLRRLLSLVIKFWSDECLFLAGVHGSGCNRPAMMDRICDNGIEICTDITTFVLHMIVLWVK